MKALFTTVLEQIPNFSVFSYTWFTHFVYRAENLQATFFGKMLTALLLLKLFNGDDILSSRCQKSGDIEPKRMGHPFNGI